MVQWAAVQGPTARLGVGLVPGLVLKLTTESSPGSNVTLTAVGEKTRNILEATYLCVKGS